MLLIIDNYDSFTYNLLDYFAQLGEECAVWRNDACTLADIEQLQAEILVISPGPKTPLDAGITMSAIARFHQKLPMLGICLGHQAIGEFFGAKLVRAERPMHGFTSIMEHHRHPIFTDLPKQFGVMRYHSLLLQKVKNPLSIIAKTRRNEIMAIAHNQLPIAGFQFHPESILTENGLEILKNSLAWLRKVRKTQN